MTISRYYNNHFASITTFTLYFTSMKLSYSIFKCHIYHLVFCYYQNYHLVFAKSQHWRLVVLHTYNYYTLLVFKLSLYMQCEHQNYHLIILRVMTIN